MFLVGLLVRKFRHLVNVCTIIFTSIRIRGRFISTDFLNLRTMLSNLVAVSCFVHPSCEFIASSVCTSLVAG